MKRFAIVCCCCSCSRPAAPRRRSTFALQQPYRGYPGAEQFVEIPPGAGTRAIGDRLVAAGVVRDPLDLPRGAVDQRRRRGVLKAGEYRFDRPMTPLEVDRQDRARRRVRDHRHVSRRADDRGDGADLRVARPRAGRRVRRGGAGSRRSIRGLDPAATRSRGLSVSRHLRAAAPHRRADAWCGRWWTGSSTCSRRSCGRRPQRAV